MLHSCRGTANRQPSGRAWAHGPDFPFSSHASYGAACAPKTWQLSQVGLGQSDQGRQGAGDGRGDQYPLNKPEGKPRAGSPTCASHWRTAHRRSAACGVDHRMGRALHLSAFSLALATPRFSSLEALLADLYVRPCGKPYPTRSGQSNEHQFGYVTTIDLHIHTGR